MKVRDVRHATQPHHPGSTVESVGIPNIGLG